MLSALLPSEDFLQQTAISILSKGRIPKHIGLILDGNRRFAKQIGESSTLAGHQSGYKQLMKVVELCMQLGIDEITVYAFSIENFKRTQEEVDYLMDLFEKAFLALCGDNELIAKYDVRVQILGQLENLPPKVVDAARKVMDETSHRESKLFNICCPYTSRDEMTTSIKKNVKMIEDGQLDLKDINQNTIQQQLFTSPVDILVRTSGEIRLSDFLLHQASNGCQIQFIECLWPEVTIWKLLPVLLEYQLYSS
ncbi:di-trans,poly-cis-decaprenylcistransferase [Chlamydoabsidia padenii]|nr:di-trans,poly-cis-decaprenylcistransferase [Chlamydoabsidia padenii]